MRNPLYQCNLINPLRLCVQFQHVVHLPHHTSQRISLFIRHFGVVEKMALRFDEQRSQWAQLGWRMAEHPVLIFIDIPAGRGGFLSLMLAAEKAIHDVYQMIPS